MIIINNHVVVNFNLINYILALRKYKKIAIENDDVYFRSFLSIIVTLDCGCMLAVSIFSLSIFRHLTCRTGSIPMSVSYVTAQAIKIPRIQNGVLHTMCNTPI